MFSSLLGLTILLLLPVAASAIEEQVVIDVPNPCVEFEKVKKDRVYLKSTSDSCMQVISKKSVSVDSSIHEVEVYIDGRRWNRQIVSRFDMTSITDALDKAVLAKKGMEIPGNDNDAVAFEKAKETALLFNTKEFQERVKRERDQLLNTVFSVPGDRHKEKAPIRKALLAPEERLYIFISSSIPIETLRTYSAAMDILREEGMVFVLRGFIGDLRYIGPTMKFSSQVLFKNRDCDISKGECETLSAGFVIDPLLYRRYNITKVPAFVYVPRVVVSDPDTSEGIEENARASGHYAVYGDASLDYVLDQLHKETKKQAFGALAERLRKGYY